jgi:hypothetical protein
MQRRFGIVALLLAALVARAADENFSRAVRPEDFSAAGLNKLSPDELARLDTLVRDYKSGALAAAQREAEAAAQARAMAETRAAQAEAKAAAAARAEAAAKEEKAKPVTESTSLLAKAKVLLTPGTKVEYATVESRIRGDFRGWNGSTVFALEDGSHWKVQNNDSYVTPSMPGPKVTITPSTFGGFWMKIEGVSPKVRVAPLGGN